MLFLPFLFLVLICSCDKIKQPYIKTIKHTLDTVEARKMLLEEFTGDQCINCPNGSTQAEYLKNSVFGNSLILISVNAGFYAIPNSQYPYDFRCTVSDTLDNYFHGNPLTTTLGYPMGMVNRLGWLQSNPLNVCLSVNQWRDTIANHINDVPKISIELYNSYNPATRVVSSSVECDALMSLTSTYRICSYLTEDSIIKPQEFPQGVDSLTYVHRHVLRGALDSNPWGVTFIQGNTANGAQFTKNYTMVLDTAWNANHCSVVTFLYDASNYEIIQAEEKGISISSK